ncbi:hypothetical protein OKW45_004577 [Paraburkholderia sp. WSM4175]|uniref:hypothetical protein n=1 Tax=Paraburkholderia sp. WSM4175 TaxID=2991072 RepID=UPI003D1FF102
MQITTNRQLEHARVRARDHRLAGMQPKAADAKKIDEPHDRREHAAIRVAASKTDRVVSGASQTDGEFDREIGRRRALAQLNARPNDKTGVEQTVCQQFRKRQRFRIRIATAQQFEREVNIPESVEHLGFAIRFAPWRQIASQQTGEFRLCPYQGLRRHRANAALGASMNDGVVDWRSDEFARRRQRTFPRASLPAELIAHLLLDRETLVQIRGPQLDGKALRERALPARRDEDTCCAFTERGESLESLNCARRVHAASLACAPTLWRGHTAPSFADASCSSE